MEKVFTRMKNIWCNLKDTLGIIRSLLQILMKLVEGPQILRDIIIEILWMVKSG